MISSRAVAGTRSLSSRRLPLLPRRGSPALTVPGWLRRVRGGCVCRCRGWARAPRRAFWASRVRPAPVRVPSSRVPARRFKDPGGVALPSPGSGGGGARRDVGRPREGFPVPPHVRRSLRLSGAPLRPPALPEAAVRGGVSRAPSGRPRGSRPERLACPARWRAAAGCRVRGVPCPVCPAFPSPTLSFFFISYVCLVSFLAGRPEAEPPRRRAPPIPRRRGGRGRLLRSSAPRVSPLTPQITDTTLSGGSLGSCVDEERS